jgi:hypothetical protein
MTTRQPDDHKSPCLTGRALNNGLLMTGQHDAKPLERLGVWLFRQGIVLREGGEAAECVW